jgi:DNA-binding LytR/AlgR family response regulator
MNDTPGPEPVPVRDATGLDWRTYPLVAGVALAIGVVNALSIAHDHVRVGRAYALGEPLFWELTSVGIVALLAPVVAAAVARLRGVWLDRRWLAAATIAALTVIGFSAVHVVGMVMLRHAGAAFYGASYHFDWSPAELAYEFRKDLVTCVLLGLTFWLMLSRREMTRARAAASTGASPAMAASHLWLRDGTTSIRVAPRDVVSVSSAGNYVEYRMIGGAAHLVRATLANEEPRLEPFGVVRVHRTRLVNLHRVIGVVPRPSGDFQLRLDNGETVACSRRYRSAISRLAVDGDAAVPLTNGQEGPRSGLVVR